MLDVNLLAAIHTWCLFPHFSWAQKSDTEVGAAPSFLSRHMLAQHFLMVTDIESVMESNWKSLEKIDERKATTDVRTNEEKM